MVALFQITVPVGRSILGFTLKVTQPRPLGSMLSTFGGRNSAIRLIKKLKPDLLLLDLSMQQMKGFSVLREIKAAMPEVKILILSIHESDQYVLQALEAKADDYATKDSTRDELRVGIRSVLEGKKYISPGVARNVLEGYIEARKTLRSKT
jgi:DNA-binding NarL/FixJ family response regulator